MTDPRTLTEPELLAIHAQLTTHGNPTPTTAHLAARSKEGAHVRNRSRISFPAQILVIMRQFGQIAIEDEVRMGRSQHCRLAQQRTVERRATQAARQPCKTQRRLPPPPPFRYLLVHQ